MFTPATNLSQQVSNFAERVAKEMRVQQNSLSLKVDKTTMGEYLLKSDAENNYATKKELDEKVDGAGGGTGTAEFCQQLISFYNGLESADLDYRDFLGRPTEDYLAALYSFGNGYNGAD